jgi:hypothetical protein
MMKFSDLKAAHKPREKRVTLVLDGALLAEHEALSEQLVDTMSRRTSLGDPASVGLSERVAEVEAAIAASTCEFVLVGVGRNRYRQIQAEHTGEDDALDMDGYIPALLKACITEPADTDVDWLMEHLTLGQVDELFGAAFAACREADRVPFNPLVSHPTPD